MKTKNVSIVLLSLIVLTACGSKNSRNIEGNHDHSGEKFFDLTTAEVINTVNAISSVGKTQLTVVAGSPQSQVNLQTVGQMKYQLKQVDYTRGDKGNPEPLITPILSSDSFPVYFVGKNEESTSLVAIAPKNLVPYLTPTNFKKETKEYVWAKESRCVAYQQNAADIFGQVSVECKFLEQTCKTSLGGTGIPASTYRDSPLFHCIRSAEDFTKSETVSNSLDSDSLIVSINPEQSSVELRTRAKKNNKTFLATSLLTFQESSIAFKLGNGSATQ